jgi:hypothetical protein
MGYMKALYTELNELGIDPSSLPLQEALDVAKKLDLQDRELGEIQDIPRDIANRIRRAANDEFTNAVQQKFQYAKHILLSKHKDYGPTNISQSPGGALNGLRVRMWDKFARINNLIDSGATPEHESLKDSFLDMANYAIIAMLVLDNEWPKE